MRRFLNTKIIARFCQEGLGVKNPFSDTVARSAPEVDPLRPRVSEAGHKLGLSPAYEVSLMRLWGSRGDALPGVVMGSLARGSVAELLQRGATSVESRCFMRQPEAAV